ncbi:neprilysin-11-like [Haemaphysalis longicornis]
MDEYKRLLREGPSVTVHREDINKDMIDVNAQYLPLFHVVLIKTGLMLPPFTPAGVPNAIPYGAIGRMLGYDPTRAFDPVNANVTRTDERMDWYTQSSMSSFLSRLMRVQAFADKAGTEMARLTYETLPERKGLLGNTPEQAFYVASCFAFCGSSPHFPYTYKYLAYAPR